MLVLVAVALLALVGATALVLLAGSVEWQRNQIQELADATALDATFKIGVGCDAGKARVVIQEADAFLTARRGGAAGLGPTPGSCAASYTGSDTFAGGLSATYNYPYRAHQQQVEVILTLTLPISFGSEIGVGNTKVIRRAVAGAPQGFVPAISATTLTCAAGQVNVAGSVATQNQIARNGTCALYAHTRFDVPSGTYSDLGNVQVYAAGQAWLRAGGRCMAGLNTGSRSAICADGFEESGHTAVACGTSGTTEYLSVGDRTINPNPCAAGVSLQPVTPLTAILPPEPNLDPSAIASMVGNGGAPCTAGATYPVLRAGGKVVGSSLMTPAPVRDARGFWHFRPSCYGYLDLGPLKPDRAVLDPGFYYFNGSRFAAGGGICLNGNVLLARDVTLEFVNRTGFSTGTCAVGGGGNCAAPCQFGSQPCSLRACPPNARADPPLNFTWFAAPCSLAPSAVDAASCPVSAWCPAGDRACSNLLIWAPRGIAGRITIAGPRANAWLLGSISWPGTFNYTVNGTSTIAGAVSCTALSITAAAAATIAVGGDYGVSTALAEAQLIE